MARVCWRGRVLRIRRCKDNVVSVGKGRRGGDEQVTRDAVLADFHAWRNAEVCLVQVLRAYSQLRDLGMRRGRLELAGLDVRGTVVRNEMLRDAADVEREGLHWREHLHAMRNTRRYLLHEPLVLELLGVSETADEGAAMGVDCCGARVRLRLCVHRRWGRRGRLCSAILLSTSSDVRLLLDLAVQLSQG